MRALVFAVLVSSAPALAQSQTEGPSQPAPLVESGSYLGMGLGAQAFFGLPGDASRNAFGQTLRLELRFNFIERVGLSLFVFASAIRPGPDYSGPAPGGVQGDFTVFSPGASLRFNLFGGIDPLNVRRWWIYLRGGAGYSMFWPRALAGNGDIFVFGALGLEWRTYVRHFSVGLEVMPSHYLTSGANTALITPYLHFAF